MLGQFLGRQREWEHLPETSKTIYRRLAHSLEAQNFPNRMIHGSSISVDIPACLLAKLGFGSSRAKKLPAGQSPPSLTSDATRLLSKWDAAQLYTSGTQKCPWLHSPANAQRSQATLGSLDGCGPGISIQLSQITTGTERG